jgi:hypothetical protein
MMRILEAGLAKIMIYSTSMYNEVAHCPDHRDVKQ